MWRQKGFCFHQKRIPAAIDPFLFENDPACRLGRQTMMVVVVVCVGGKLKGRWV